ncbi:Ca-activated chloride channel family protein [Brevibacillus aydinogluensis]|jgi:Ca-activated chloride channel homolog|uniref:VWA domain-containing protein n=1 Tax=Brevibacillus TaxID=55080 RepID=UPI001B9082A6|nr:MULTISPECIES: VWA domain-containing protein [Brevibacillus]MBR8658921.1 VWA domain-containing protein [Brevibacillus sp. NL20B1]MDT3416327.1 Ca-activated chloride channel family protein [Brevibacillus aydinogluensis]
MTFINRWTRMLGGLILIMSLGGCSWGTAVTGSAPDTSRLPQTTQELIAAQPGPLAGTHFYLTNHPQHSDIAKILDRLPLLVDGVDEAMVQVYGEKLLSLFAEDYASPQTVVDRWRVASFGNPDIEDTRLQFKEHFNVEIILDASGSMAGKIGEKTKMQLAKEAIQAFAESLPEGARVSLRVYGHKGSNADKHKQLSCGSSELVYPLQPFDAQRLEEALQQFEPTGWTSIARSLQLAQADLATYGAENNTNVIYLVSDGIETCDGDPVAAAKELSNSHVMPLLNVIGFDVNADGQKQLKQIAQAAEGLYANVTNQEQFQAELERAREIAEKWDMWKRDALTEAEAVRIDRHKWIDMYDRDWYEKNWRESLNVGAAIEYLAATGKIGSQAKTYLTRMRQEREALVTRSKEELTDYLLNLTEESFEEMKEEIERKYRGE